MMQKTWKLIEILAHGYSFWSASLSNVMPLNLSFNPYAADG